MRIIRHVSVLGSGVMGAGIAAHLANAGFQVLILDLPSDQGPRNQIAAQALAQAIKQKPAPFYHKDFVSRITVGNFEDDLQRNSDPDYR